MKRLFWTLGCIISVVVSADVGTTAPNQQHKRTKEERAEHRRISSLKRTGGVIRKENSASGKVLFINAQKLVKIADIQEAFDEIDKRIHPIYEIKDLSTVNLVNPANDIRKLGGNVAVILADTNDLPPLLTAPEEGWAIVNVRAIAKSGADKLNLRTRRELLRAFALAGGCSFMARGQILLRGDVRQPSDLDSFIDDTYEIEAVMTLERSLPYYGVMPWKQTTYKKACQEGWAPAPTNEFQKAIWDKVHAMPTEPIKIKPEAKKVEK